MSGTPAGSVRLVDASGGKDRLPQAVVTSRGATKYALVASVPHGYQVVFWCIRTGELLLHALAIATRHDN